ncbi:hypothetical protein SAMN04487911_12038 [Arenibacter nanhaiticus]|uniref:LexA-binding, inner membrane-associated hydrolase n=1 Tax=Arenibacter nanhaiticus TaxID=558155 RepID=A0A1M6J3J5_9FLAO|nr:DUF6122 family protein [Arenibacter nanhaiticus]SHJ41268.1 hypothetical protein SAMN04487911_12038 [Arenibacter nanhaiticus]
MLRFCVHYGIHFLVPIAIGLLFYKKQRFTVIAILLAGIIIDIDHVFADPLFDPNRCSINFHPLHTYWAIALYVAMLIPKKTRIFGLALVIHIAADITDCLLM